MIADLKPYPAYRDSGIEWLGEVPEGWEVRRLRAIARTPIRNGLGESAGDFRPDWPRYIRITDITGPRTLSEVGAASLPPAIAAEAEVADGDVLFAAVGATVGKSYLHRGEKNPACFAGYLVRLAPNDEVVPEFISYWTESTDYWSQVNRNAVKATIENLSASRYKRMQIPLPPLSDQISVSGFLDHVNSRIQRFIAVKERLVELLEEEKQAIIHRAITQGLDSSVPLRPSGVDWLGEVPEHWEIQELRRLGQIQGGMTPSMNRSEYWGGSIPWVSPKDMKRTEIDSSIDSVTPVALAETSLLLIPPGSVLMVVRGMILARRVPVAWTSAEVYQSGHEGHLAE